MLIQLYLKHFFCKLELKKIFLSRAEKGLNAMGQDVEIEKQRRNNSKAQIAANKLMENLFIVDDTVPIISKPNKSNKVTRKMFKTFVEAYPHYGERDSESINKFVTNKYLKDQLEMKLMTLDESEDFDENFERLQMRLEKIDKKIETAMKELKLTYDGRLSQAHAMAKLMVEQQKAEAMEKAAKPAQIVNPLMQIANKNRKEGV